MEVLSLQPQQIHTLNNEELLAAAQNFLALQAQERQHNQLRYYAPASEESREIHLATQRTIGVGGGNGSSKTDTALVEMVIRATGQIPLSLKDTYPREKLHGPIACRVVCESLTTTLEPIILPKLRWYNWSGVSRAGGEKGHWGWIPRNCLINGDWKASWTQRTRTLRVLYRETENPDRVLGESTIQFMSYDQDPSDFASGDFHFVLHDEPPKEAIWRENVARVMRVDGTIMVAMTWPDDPTINVDWIYDELYERAFTDPAIKWVNLSTLKNPHLKQTAVAERAAQMSALTRATRIFGQPIRMSNRVHPLFTDTLQWWCFECKEIIVRTDEGTCGKCLASGIVSFTHVVQRPVQGRWPVIYGLDPHPRKPHMMLWVQVDPNDDLHVLHQGIIPGTPADVKAYCDKVEQEYGMRVAQRLIDPNMGRSPSSSDRATTWQDSFDKEGLYCDLADDNEAGRKEIDRLLQPDPDTSRPRLLIDPSCTEVIYQMKRYLWDDYRRSTDKAQKQRAKEKHDDFPTILKYITNSGPSFRSLHSGGCVIHRMKRSTRYA